VDKSAKGSGYFDLPPGTLMEKMPDMGAAPGGMGLPPGMNMEDMQKQMEEAMKQMKQMQQQR
jgi:membrane protease subunit (stomatin/prohibitin family)